MLFNLLVPAGWKVGLLRIEDVAIGCAVSLAVGVLFWPRGASGIVGDDLADAFRSGGAYLTEAVDWALGVRSARPTRPPPPSRRRPARRGAARLPDEQGAKHVSKDELWRLVIGEHAIPAHRQLTGRPAPLPVRHDPGQHAPGQHGPGQQPARTAGS